MNNLKMFEEYRIPKKYSFSDRVKDFFKEDSCLYGDLNGKTVQPGDKVIFQMSGPEHDKRGPKRLATIVTIYPKESELAGRYKIKFDDKSLKPELAYKWELEPYEMASGLKFELPQRKGGKEPIGDPLGNPIPKNESVNIKTFEEMGSGDLPCGSCSGGKKKKKNKKNMLKPNKWTKWEDAA